MTDRLGEALAQSPCGACGGNGGFHFGWCARGIRVDDQMTEAVGRQMERRRASQAIDRKGWTDDQWIEDAERLMDEPDGAITSLVNGHVLALLRQVAAARNWHTLEPHLNDLDSIVSLILHRHNIDPPLPFDERQRLQAAIGAIRRVDALTDTADEAE